MARTVRCSWRALELWDSGDRAGSLEAMPDSVVDDLIVHGTPNNVETTLIDT